MQSAREATDSGIGYITPCREYSLRASVAASVERLLKRLGFLELFDAEIQTATERASRKNECGLFVLAVE